MASKIQIRRDTAADWTSANPTLSMGELGLETDTKKLKAGDGSTAWTSLAYYTLSTTGYAAYSDATANFTGNLQEGGADVLITGGALGTPSGGTATNLTGLPVSTGVSGLASNVATFLGTPTSVNLASAVTNETGSGALVFATSPTLVTPALGTPSSGTLTSATGLPLTTGVTGVLPNANGGSGAITPVLKGVGYTAINRDYIIATAGSITITLPSSPTAGDTVTIKDGTGAAATTAFTVGRAGSNIASAASDLTFDKNWAEVVLTYIDGTIGWSV